MLKKRITGLTTVLRLAGTEIFLGLSTAWATKCLLSNDHVFQTVRDYYRLLKDLGVSQSAWGWFCLISCTFGALGLLLSFKSTKSASRELGFLLRVAALGMCTFFWTIVGLSFTIANSDSLPALPQLLMGMMALRWIIIGPVMPDDG